MLGGYDFICTQLCGRKEAFYLLYIATALHFSYAKLATPASYQ